MLNVHRTRPGVAPALLGVLLLTAPAAAQPASGSATLSIAAPPASSVTATRENGATILERAEQLAEEGRFQEAKAEYARAAEAQRKEGVLPSVALRGLAQMYFGESRPRRSAAILSGLAAEAERVGALDVQARALLDAAFLYRSEGLVHELQRTVVRLEPLRTSPYVSPELRDLIQQRIPLG
jgi:hypothetical protein